MSTDQSFAAAELAVILGRIPEYQATLVAHIDGDSTHVELRTAVEDYELLPGVSWTNPLAASLGAPSTLHLFDLNESRAFKTRLHAEAYVRVLGTPDGGMVSLGCEVKTTDYAAREIRYAGINAPEMSTAAGKVALAYVEANLPAAFTVRTPDDRPDKYGRVLGWLILPDGRCLNRMLVDSGNAVVYGDLPVDAPAATVVV